jgi:hypothetical protein
MKVAHAVALLLCFGDLSARAQTSAPIGPTANVSSAASTFSAINVQGAPYNATGNTLSFTDGTIAAGTNLLASASHACNATIDPGKQIILHGSGASGAPQQGSITACSGANFVLSFSAIAATPWNGAWSATPATAQSGAGSYAPGDVLTCSGGVGVIANCTFTIASTQIVSPTINANGSGGANGPCTLQGTTGAGIRFQVSGTVSGGAVNGALTIVNPGAYTANPTSLSAEPVVPVSGCAGLIGATVAIKMGALAVASVNPGQATTWPSPNTPTTSGAGTGATLNLIRYQVGGAYTFGTVDTAAVAGAVGAAQLAASGNGKQVYFPAGAYWLASQNTCLSINDMTLSGDGWPNDNIIGSQTFPGGSTLLISNASTSAFCGMNSVTFRDLAVYYPMQDGSQIAPVVYPPLFESAIFVDDSFVHNRFMNPYILLKVDNSGAASGLGRVFWSNNCSYPINTGFWFQNGAADTLQIDATNYFGQGCYGAIPIAGPANLSKYSSASAQTILIDLAAATYKQVDGIIGTGFIVQGQRFFLRIVGGLLDVSNFSNVNGDGVGSMLSVEGVSQISSTTFSGGEIFSQNVQNPAQAANVFNFVSSSNNSDLEIGGGMKVQFAQGSVVADLNAGLANLTVGNVEFNNFGRSTTSGNYGAIYLAASNAVISVTGVKSTCSGVNATYFALIAGFESGNLTGNSWSGCYYGIVDTRSGALLPVLATGNYSQATPIVQSLQVTGASPSFYEANNYFDRPPQPTLTSGWGTGATLTPSSSDNFSRITVGAAPSSPAILTFNFKKPVAPACTALNETTSLNLTAVASAAAVIVTGAFAANSVVSVQCRYN